MRETRVLFCDGDLSVLLDKTRESISSRVDSIPRDQFLNTNLVELARHILSTINLGALVIFEDRAEMEQRETKIDVSEWKDRHPFGDFGPTHIPGMEVVVTIPFTGDSSLWRFRPNQYSSKLPRANIIAPNSSGIGHLEIIISQPANEDPGRVKARLDEELRVLRFYVEAQNKQIEIFNKGVEGPIIAAIKVRKERLKRYEGIDELLRIPLKRRDGTPSFKPIEIARKLVRPLPPPPKSGFQPEPGITDEEYHHILDVIRHVGRTFETTPKTYFVHDEEELRDILLAHLNGHYQGAATGEAFRRIGKTDIRIEDQNRAAFIAECKIWRGKKELSDATDQLLGYLTWRDCKAALIVFNKNNAKFSELLERIPEAIKAHEKFRQVLKEGLDGEWEFLMTSREDDARQVRVHVFVFNLFTV